MKNHSQLIPKACTGALAIAMAALGLATLGAQDANEDIRSWRATCMKETGNEPLCACMANALKSHVPKEHFSHKDGRVEFSDAMPQEVHDKVTKAALECETKFGDKR